jgi:L-ascorbate metabolism protein UlaG (beta-lactamase superfamily)
MNGNGGLASGGGEPAPIGHPPNVSAIRPTGVKAIPPRAPSGPEGSTRVTYLGHATVLIESGGETIVTDPVFSNRVAHVFTKRTSPSEFRPETLGRVAGVLISHAHHDHLDYPSLKRIQPPPPMVVPWGVSAPMRWRGYREIRVTREWETTRVGPWTVVAVPSRHFGGRLPLLWTSGHLGYVLSGPSCIYFAGDTGLDETLFREVGRRFEIDLAILPIAGAVFPWFRSNHMNAEDALLAFEWLGARQMLPIHFGTFPASFEPADEPLRHLNDGARRRGVSGQVIVLPEGSSLSLPGASRSPPDPPSARFGAAPESLA